MSKTIASFIITPDGTKLQSFHVHDFKTHADKNGEQYMIDGGTEYQHGSVNKEPAEVRLVTMDDPHHLRRKHFHWGSYGKDGKQPLRWIALEDMETEHINAVLETQHHLQDWTKQLFNDELQWRISHEALDKLAQTNQELGLYDD